MSEDKFHVYFHPKPKTFPAQICYVYPEGYVEINRHRDSRDLLNEQRIALEKWSKKLEDSNELKPNSDQEWKKGAFFMSFS